MRRRKADAHIRPTAAAGYALARFTSLLLRHLSALGHCVTTLLLHRAQRAKPKLKNKSKIFRDTALDTGLRLSVSWQELHVNMSAAGAFFPQPLQAPAATSGFAALGRTRSEEATVRRYTWALANFSVMTFCISLIVEACPKKMDRRDQVLNLGGVATRMRYRCRIQHHYHMRYWIRS